MGNFYRDNDDLRYYVDKGIDWGPLVELTEYFYTAPDGFKDQAEALEFYGDILELVGEFVANEIAPHAEEIDRNGVAFIDGEAQFPPRLAGIFEAIRGLELHGMCLPRELGGMNAPLMLYMLNTEMFSRADVSVSTHYGFHGGIALAMLAYSLREGTTTFDLEGRCITSTRFQEEIAEIARGDAWGCMDITEPNAGSDMAALRTLATRDEEGNWRVTGQKIFITSGHGKYHFVIARTEGSETEGGPGDGLDGLSMFLVPTYHEHPDGTRERIVTINRLEEKLGHHASATCSLSFDEAPARLVGEIGEGFKYMLLLMNNARLGVGFECLGICEAALRMAREYAAERRSMGKTIDRHEMIADYLDEMASDIEGIRALAVTGTLHEELSQKIQLLQASGAISDDLKARALTDSLDHHKRITRRLTPLLKYLAGEKCVEISRRCIQIHGGVGFTKDFGAEKLLRDAMVMPIYEGTSQIQALMVMKDSLSGMLKDPQAFVRDLAQTTWRARSVRDSLERRVAKLHGLALRAQKHLLTKTATNKMRALRDKPFIEWPRLFMKEWNPKRDFAYAMLHAERLTRILADDAVCELLFEQSQRHPERRAVLVRYLERAEPRARFLYHEITTTGQRLLDELAESEPSVEQAAS